MIMAYLSMDSQLKDDFLPLGFHSQHQAYAIINRKPYRKDLC